MEINEVSMSVTKALTTLQSLQKMTAMNIANATTGVNKKYVFDISDVLKNVQQTPNTAMNTVSSTLFSNSGMIESTAIELDQEVITSRQISGRFTQIVEGYNKQLGLYQLALGKGR